MLVLLSVLLSASSGKEQKHDYFALSSDLLFRILSYICVSIDFCIFVDLLSDQEGYFMNLQVVLLFAILLTLLVGLFVKE